MYWPFAIHWLGAVVWAWTFEFRSSYHVCHCGAVSESPVAGYLSLWGRLLQIHFHSPCQFAPGTLICNDGWGDAWKSKASQTTHQDFLIGVLAVSCSRRVAATVAKSDSQNQKLDIPAHKRLPKMCPVHSLSYQTRVLSDSAHAYRAEVSVFC